MLAHIKLLLLFPRFCAEVLTLSFLFVFLVDAWMICRPNMVRVQLHAVTMNYASFVEVLIESIDAFFFQITLTGFMFLLTSAFLGFVSILLQ
jgi:hypothetical protein